MHTHVVRSRKSSIWGTRYALSIRIYTDAEERRILHEHRLDRVELWADPLRDEFAAAAAAAHDKAKQSGVLVYKMRDTATITANEIAALIKTIRSSRAFHVRITEVWPGQLEMGGARRRRKAAAFERWHEPDEARVSSPDL